MTEYSYPIPNAKIYTHRRFESLLDDITIHVRGLHCEREFKRDALSTRYSEHPCDPEMASNLVYQCQVIRDYLDLIGMQLEVVGLDPDRASDKWIARFDPRVSTIEDFQTAAGIILSLLTKVSITFVQYDFPIARLAFVLTELDSDYVRAFRDSVAFVAEAMSVLEMQLADIREAATGNSCALAL